MSGSVARILTLVGAGGATVAAFTLTDFKFKCCSAALPAVRIFDAETAHRLTIGAAKYGLLPSDNRKDDARLRVHLWGRTFSNPLGIAAGFDKDAEAIEPVLNMGLGFMEVGSIPPRPQPGNPAPRCFRIPEHNAIVNRMGFNSQGIQGALPRLQTYHTRRQDGEADQSKVLFVNLGKNKETKDGAADFVEGVEKLLPFADAIVVNVSSPNTPGLRSLQGRKELTDIVRRVRAAMDTASQPHAPLPVAAPAHPHPPLLIKIAPDLSDADRADIAAVATAKSPAVDGLVISNTTVSRPPSVRGAAAAAEAGGLSGAPVMAASTEVLADMYRRTNGAVPLVGCGGVMSGGDAYAKIRAGASLVELYTALVYKGPALIPEIKRELLRCLEADGFSSVEEAVGADHRKYTVSKMQAMDGGHYNKKMQQQIILTVRQAKGIDHRRFQTVSEEPSSDDTDTALEAEVDWLQAESPPDSSEADPDDGSKTVLPLSATQPTNTDSIEQRDLKVNAALANGQRVVWVLSEDLRKDQSGLDVRQCADALTGPLSIVLQYVAHQGGGVGYGCRPA